MPGWPIRGGEKVAQRFPSGSSVPVERGRDPSLKSQEDAMAAGVEMRQTVGRTVFELLETNGLFRGQKFHVRISDTNGEALYWSEKYARKEDAQKVMQRAVSGWAVDG
jgi:hypothetical protein